MLTLDERVHLAHPSRVILALSGDPQKPEARKNLERLVAAGVQVRSAGGVFHQCAWHITSGDQDV